MDVSQALLRASRGYDGVVQTLCPHADCRGRGSALLQYASEKGRWGPGRGGGLFSYFFPGGASFPWASPRGLSALVGGSRGMEPPLEEDEKM